MGTLYEELVSRLEVLHKSDLNIDTEPLIELMSRYDIKDVALVNKMVVGLMSSKMQAVALKPEATPENLVRNGFLLDKIMPWVEQTREILFGSKGIPFNGYDEAEKWWLDALRDELKRRMAGKADNTLQSFRAEARKIAMVTGFNFYSLLMYVLTGIEPDLPMYIAYTEDERYELPSGEVLVNRPVTVRIAAELNFRELRSLYHGIRKELKIERAKRFNEKHLELCQLVRRMGGPPKGKGVVSFWESVRAEWDRRHPREHKSWKATKIAYDRTMQKLERNSRPGKK